MSMYSYEHNYKFNSHSLKFIVQSVLEKLMKTKLCYILYPIALIKNKAKTISMPEDAS